jgi:hypothetical protein
MCLKCEKTRDDKPSYYCPCGGERVYRKEMEWIIGKNEKLYLDDIETYEKIKIGELNEPVLYKFISWLYPNL